MKADIAKIREYTNDSLYFVLDCVGGEVGGRISAEAISSQGGHLCSINSSTKYPRDDVRTSTVLAYKTTGEKWFFGEEMPATIEDYECERALQLDPGEKCMLTCLIVYSWENLLEAGGETSVRRPHQDSPAQTWQWIRRRPGRLRRDEAG